MYPPHSDAAHEAITAELVRLTLPHHPATDRPELESALEEERTPRRLRRKGKRK